MTEDQNVILGYCTAGGFKVGQISPFMRFKKILRLFYTDGSSESFILKTCVARDT